MSLVHRLLRKPFFGRFEVPWQFPRDATESRWERITFTGAKGARLSGLIGAADVEPIGSLVLAHPMGKAAKAFWLRHGHADLFRRAGFNVLAFDFNGFGESEPTSFDYPGDALAAARVMRERFPALNVGLVGASAGAGWGLCAMARPDSPFRAAVLEAAFPTLPDFWKHYAFAHAVLRVSQVVMPWFERSIRPEAAAARVVGNPDVLLIHGTEDRFTPVEHGERLLRAMQSSARAELVVLPGVDHTYAYRDAAAKYEACVIPFLQSALS